jgi:hypothetical protein
MVADWTVRWRLASTGRESGLDGHRSTQLRKIETLDRKEILERLEAIDDAKRFYRYELVAGIPASRYTGTLEVTPKGSGSIANWRVQFLGPDPVRRMLSPLLRAASKI